MTSNRFDYAKLDHPEVVRLLFHPRSKDAGWHAPAGASDLHIVVEEGITIGARFHVAGTTSPNILFFHGNGEIVSDYDPIGPIYNEHGLNLFAVDYRGYGRSGGLPAGSSMMRDAHAIFKEARHRLKDGGHTGPVIVMGRSLGSASALELAFSYEDDIAGLIIESGFARTVPLLNRLGIDAEALGITEADGFNNLEKIKHVTKPTLIIHAGNDQIIPVQSAEELQSHCGARNKQFQVVPGADHNTIMMRAGMLYFQMIKKFADKIEGKREKRFFRKRQTI